MQERGIINAESLAYVIPTAQKTPLDTFNFDFLNPFLK